MKIEALVTKSNLKLVKGQKLEVSDQLAEILISKGFAKKEEKKKAATKQEKKKPTTKSKK